MRLGLLGFGLLGLPLAACTLTLPAVDDGATSSTDTSGVGQSETGVVAPPTTTGAPTTTTSETGGTATGGTATGDGSSAGFIAAPDGGAFGLPCDPYAQDCPEGHKCSWWDEASGGGLTVTRCVELAADPAQVGEPCHAEGDGFTGRDDCERGAMCWPIDEDRDGTCVALCGGHVRAPTCAPDSVCSIPADGVALCIEVCDPLAQDCPAGQLCLPDGGPYLCTPDLSGEEGQLHDPCSFVNLCDPGLLCAPASAAVECDQEELGCCEPFCDLDRPDTCPGAGQVCTPVFTPQPPESADIGFCRVP